VRTALVSAGVEQGSHEVDVLQGPQRGLAGIGMAGRGVWVALVPSVELKYPREPNLANAAWTTSLGEVLKDLYRLVAYPGAVDRVFVYLETAHLRRYMAGVAHRYGVDLDADTVVLRPVEVAALPSTATGTPFTPDHDRLTMEAPCVVHDSPELFG
jgi:hypothetical protein